MAVKTVVINQSDTLLKLKEGNGGVYINLKNLEQRTGKYTIRCNTRATYREYWVGTGLENEDGTVLTITSDDCVEYQTVKIINDPDNPGKLKLDNVKRGVTETVVVNQTREDVTMLKSGGQETVLKGGEKFVIKRGPEETKDCNYSVVAGGETIKISTQEVAKAQRINISEVNTSTPRQANASTPGQANASTPGQASTSTPGQANTSTPGQPKVAKLDMVSRRLHLTEVTNKTSAAIKVKHHKGDGFLRGGNTCVDVKTLQKGDKFTIEYDPKKGRDWSVEYEAGTAPTSHEPVLITSTDFAEFERIDIVTKGASGTELDLNKLERRSCMGPSKNGIMSRFLRYIGF